MSHKLDVYITVDTEVWWSNDDLSAIDADFDRWFHGRTDSGSFGVDYQVDRLNQYGLSAVFFVEPLFSFPVGMARLQEMVSVIQEGNQDVQMHIHSEWLPHFANAPVKTRGEHIRNFSLEDQTLLLKLARDRLVDAGAENVCAFRAGNYGANNDTLKALREIGIKYDSSYNPCYLDSACDMQRAETLYQPQWWEGVIELPISFIVDRPGHRRHAQLTAISFQEMRHALMSAWRAGWQSFVIVSHSFELLNSDRTHPDPVMLDRFDRLCAFLGAERDKFNTAVFDGAYEPGPSDVRQPLEGKIAHTGLRLAEQAWRRVTRY